MWFVLEVLLAVAVVASLAMVSPWLSLAAVCLVVLLAVDVRTP